MEYSWVFSNNDQPEGVKKMATDLKVAKQIASLLVQRGVKNYEEAQDFFRPSLDHLHDPFLMEDMDKAVNRLTQALENSERIMIYGDYDVDGSTSVALMVDYCRKMHRDALLLPYQPDRYMEGYGISIAGIEYARKEKIDLLIALDCGIRAIDQIALANEYGIDCIICDHHTPGIVLPKALAILNPKKASCTYPFKELCGCGIGFKLLQGYAIKHKKNMDELFRSLDLVAIAIAADIVPVVGENRILAYFGLRQINTQPRLGIAALFKNNGKVIGDIAMEDLVFTIAPRINAAGRIDHARSAVEMLLAENAVQTKKWNDRINTHNTERKEIDKVITTEALEMLDHNSDFQHSKSLVVWSEKWHKGVVGIVASRIIEHYYKPTIVLTIVGDEATGSARSVKGFDVYQAIDQCRSLLTKFGGHKYAAGLSMRKENLVLFRKKFEEVVASSISQDLLVPKLAINAEITPEDLLPETPGNAFPRLFRIIEQFAPFGPRNMRPLFLLKGLVDTGYSRIVGEEHLKISVKDPDTHQIFTGIAFRLANKLALIQEGRPLALIFSLEKNTYMNASEMQLNIKDLKLASEV